MGNNAGLPDIKLRTAGLFLAFCGILYQKQSLNQLYPKSYLWVPRHYEKPYLWVPSDIQDNIQKYI